jgi:putative transposase
MQHCSYKFRLYPTTDQEQVLVGWLGQLRFIWNHMLEINKKKYELEKKFEFRYDLKKRLPELKKQYDWISVPAHAAQNKVFDLDKSLVSCFKRGTGFPKFKNRHTDRSGIEINQTNAHIHIKSNQIKIPKLGWVNWVYHRKISGRLLSITIKRDGDHWYVSLLCEQEEIISQIIFNESDVVGLDLGLKDFFVSSDGEVTKTPKFYRKKQKKLARQQRKLSRKQKGSRNREKQRKRVAKIHQKIRFQRANFTHQLSSAITKQYKVVVMEDLNIKGMIKNKNLAKSISDAGWYQFISQIKYKTEWAGGYFHQISRWAPSSKTCSKCGSIRLLTLSDRIYSCSRCEHQQCRDLNAAVNIKQFGITETNRAGTVQIYACGDTSDGVGSRLSTSHVSVKQESIPSLEGSCYPLG